MKHLLLKTWMLISLLFVGIGTTWAETYTGTVANSSGNVSSSFTLNSVTWNISTTSGSGSPSITYGNAYSKKCIKFGSGANNCFGSVSLSTDYFKNNNKKVTKVVVNALGSSKKNVTFSIGSTSITSEVAANAWTAISLDNLNVTSALRLDFQLSSAGFNIQEIVVTYENAGGTVEQYSYTLETLGSGTTTFKDGSNNVIAPSQKVNSGTKIYPNFEPADGYEFTSWEYWGTSDGEELWKKVNGEYFTITKDVKFRVTYTNIVPKAKYPVTIVTPENGTLTIKDGSTVINNGDNVEEGKTLTIEVKANDGYRFKNWGYKDGDAAWVGNLTSTFTHVMPSSACSFKAIFEEIPTYTVAFSVNGVIKQKNDYKENTVVTPPTVDDINGKKFVGWVKDNVVVNPSTAPTYETISKATVDVTYVAVFADAESTGGEATTVTLKASDNFSAAVNGYNKGTMTDDKGNTWNYYATIANQSGTILVQINSNALGYNVESPDFSGNITSLSITPNNASSKDTRYFYLCSDDTNQQPSEGDLATVAVPANGKQKIDADLKNAPSFSKFYIYSNASLGIKEITLTYGGGTTYSNFTTAPLGTGTVDFVAYDEDSKWATFSSNKHVVMPQDVTVYTVTVEGKDLVMNAVASHEIPANNGVLLKINKESEEKTTKTYNIIEPGTTITSDNWMKPASETMSADNYNYKLAYKDFDNKTGLGFYWGKAEGAAFNVKAGTAYLAVPKSMGLINGFTFGDEDETAIESVEEQVNANGVIYNLAGQRISKIQKGINIVNGKKVLY